MEDPSFFKFGCTIISRILSYPRRDSPVIYLALASLHRIYLPTLQHTSEQLADQLPERSGTTGLRGISIRKVYLPRILLSDGVRSYRTFSPLPHRSMAVCFL